MDTFTKLISALSPVVTICLTLLALHVWRVQLVAKRRFEVAEEALSQSQGAVFALQHIRSMGAFGSEGSTRPKEEGESSEDTLRLNSAYIPYERITRYNDHFAALSKTMILAEIHHGKELSQAMEVLMAARNRVLIASRQLYRLRRPKVEITPERQKRIEQYEAVIWQTRQDDPDDPIGNDKLTKEIDAAMVTIEHLCRAALAVPKLVQSIRLKP